MRKIVKKILKLFYRVVFKMSPSLAMFLREKIYKWIIFFKPFAKTSTDYNNSFEMQSDNIGRNIDNDFVERLNLYIDVRTHH